MDTEKFNAVVNSFKDVGIKIPTEVLNSIEDVFEENTDENAVTAVNVYDVNELEMFQEDLTISNKAELNIDGKHTGSKCNVYTYYGDVSFSLSEHVTLTEPDGKKIEDIVNFDDNFGTIVDNPAMWAVILKETISWNTDEKDGPINKTLELLIYCPESLDGDEQSIEAVDQYDNVYKG